MLSVSRVCLCSGMLRTPLKENFDERIYSVEKKILQKPAAPPDLRLSRTVRVVEKSHQTQ